MPENGLNFRQSIHPKLEKNVNLNLERPPVLACRTRTTTRSLHVGALEKRPGGQESR